MNKYTLKCQFCGYETKIETIGRVVKVPRCPKCEGFMLVIAEKYEPEKREEEQ